MASRFRIPAPQRDRPWFTAKVCTESTERARHLAIMENYVGSVRRSAFRIQALSISLALARGFLLPRRSPQRVCNTTSPLFANSSRGYMRFSPFTASRSLDSSNNPCHGALRQRIETARATLSKVFARLPGAIQLYIYIYIRTGDAIC